MESFNFQEASILDR